MLPAVDSDVAKGWSTLLQSDSQRGFISAFLGLLESPPLSHPQTGMGPARPAGLAEHAPAKPLAVTRTGRGHRTTHGGEGRRPSLGPRFTGAALGLSVKSRRQLWVPYRCPF